MNTEHESASNSTTNSKIVEWLGIQIENINKRYSQI